MKPGREKYDSQGFGGAGRRPIRKRAEDEEQTIGRGVPVGVDEDEPFMPGEAGGFDQAEDGQGPVGEGPEEGEEFEEGAEGPEAEEPAPQPRRTPKLGGGPGKKRGLVQEPKRGRSRASSDEMTEAEFEAYQAAKNKGKRGKGAKPTKQKGSPITLGKSAGAGSKKGRAATDPGDVPTKPKQSRKPAMDDFDEEFGVGGANELPAKESALSQLIMLVEVLVGGGLSYFAATQLGNILINQIVSGG